MYKKIIILLFFLFVALSKNFAQGSPAEDNIYTLQKCIELAFRNNTDVKQAELVAESARINYNQAWNNLLPDLNADISHTVYNGRSINPYTNSYINEQNNAGSYQLTAGLTLWRGCSLQNYIRQYSLNYQAGKMDARDTKDKLTVNIILNYLFVLSSREQMNIAEKQADATRKRVEFLNLKNNDGAISPSDLYDMKGQLANDELTVVSTKNSLENARLALAQLMNVPYSDSMQFISINDTISAKPYDATIDEVYNYALERMALIKSADLKVAAARKNVKAVRGEMMPALFLAGGLYSSYSSAAMIDSMPIAFENQLNNNLNSAISIGLSIPLINRLQYRNKLHLAKIAEKQSNVQAETVRIQLRQAIEQDFINMYSEYARYRILLGQVSDFEQSFHSAEVRLADGVISTVDYVIAKNNLDRVQLNLIAVKYNYILRTKLLDFYRNRSLW